MLSYELLSVLVVFLCYLVYRLFNKKKWDLYAKLPGPTPLPILGNIGFILKRPKDTHPVTYVFNYQMGKSKIYKKEKMHLMWFGSNPILFLIAPETIEVVMSSNTSIEKGVMYRFVKPWLGDGLLLSTGDKWRKHRKLLTPSFHFRILEKFEVVMNEQALVLVTKMKEANTNSDWVDAFNLYSKCTLDIIFETSLGMSVGAQEKDSMFGKMIHHAAYGVTFRAMRPWFSLDCIFRLKEEGKSFFKAVKYLHNITEQVISEKVKERKENPTSVSETNADSEFGVKKRLAFLDLLMESELTMSEIREQVDTFMFAGHDTTATALSWMTYLLGLDPEVQKKLLEEVDSIFGDDKERHVTQDDLRQLKYMECVMKESQRVYPSVPGISRKLANDTMIGDYMVPKGTTCFISILSVHHDESHYPNPTVFDPERFNPQNSVGRHPYAFVPFSAGPRNCIGQKFALMEQKILMCHVLRNFSICSLDSRDKIELVPELVLRTSSPIRIKLTPRA